MAVLEDNYRYSNQFQREKIQLSPDSIPNAGWLAPFSHGQEQAIPEGRNSHNVSLLDYGTLAWGTRQAASGNSEASSACCNVPSFCCPGSQDQHNLLGRRFSSEQVNTQISAPCSSHKDGAACKPLHNITMSIL